MSMALLFVAVALAASAREPYKEMLAEEQVFTGTETLPLDAANTDAIVIGLFAPDGENHPVGRALTRGATLAIEEANAAEGHSDRRPIRLVRRWADDPWGAGSKEIIKLVFEDNAWALIGGPDGATTHVAQQVATKAHIPLVAPVSSDPSLTHTRVPWIFRLPPDDAVQAALLVKEGIAPLGIERVGLVSSTDHDGRTAAAEIVAALESAGLPPAFHLEIAPVTEDLESVARQVATFEVDGLVLRLAPADLRRMAPFLVAEGIEAPIFLPWIPGLDLDGFPLATTGPIRTITPIDLPRSCGPYLKFVRAFVRRYGAKPTPEAVYGYDAAGLLVAAARSGVTGRVDLRERIAALSGWVGSGGEVDWDTGGGNQAAAPVLSTP